MGTNPHKFAQDLGRLSHFLPPRHQNLLITLTFGLLVIGGTVVGASPGTSFMYFRGTNSLAPVPGTVHLSIMLLLPPFVSKKMNICVHGSPVRYTDPLWKDPVVFLSTRPTPSTSIYTSPSNHPLNPYSPSTGAKRYPDQDT